MIRMMHRPKEIWECLKIWEAKIFSIEKSNDLSTLPIDELLRKLLTHEIKMTQVVEEEKTKKDKSIALKASRDTSNSDSNEDDDELVMISRKNYKSHLKEKKRIQEARFMQQRSSHLLWMQ